MFNIILPLLTILFFSEAIETAEKMKNDYFYNAYLPFSCNVIFSGLDRMVLFILYNVLATSIIYIITL